MSNSIRHLAYFALLFCFFGSLWAGEGQGVVQKTKWSTKGDRFALLVGIDDYNSSKLKGCVNDIRALSEVLTQHYGFKHNTVLRLEDNAATRKAILRGLDDLAKRAKKGTSLVFAYAGHGKPWKDSDGDELNGYDETLCPIDHDQKDGGLISDDELYPRIKKILSKGAHLTVLLDACFSGDAFKDPTGIRQLRAQTEGKPGAGGQEEGGFWLGKELANHERLVFAAAADEREFAGEGVFKGDFPGHHGYFTHTLLGLLAKPKPGRDWNHIKPYLRSGVRSLKPDQNPVLLGGGLNNEIFGVKDSAEVGRYRVAESKNNGAEIVIDSGRTAGLLPGDRLTATEADGKIVAATYRIDMSTATKSKALRLSGSKPIMPGEPLTLIHSGVLNERPRVFLSPEVPKKLRSELTQQLFNNPFGVRLAEPCDKRGELDLRIEIKGYDYIVSGPPGRYTMPVAEASAEALARHLTRAVRWTLLRELTNHGGQDLSPAKQPRLEVERGKIYQGRFVKGKDIQKDPERGTHFLDEGDVLRLRLTNRAQANLFATVFYMKADTTIIALNDLAYRGALTPGKIHTLENMIKLEAAGLHHIKVLYSTEAPIDPSHFMQTKDSSKEQLQEQGWGVLDIPLFVEEG